MKPKLIDYKNWSQKQLLREVYFLRRALHSLAKEATYLKNENHELQDRLGKIEQHRQLFAGGLRRPPAVVITKGDKMKIAKSAMLLLFLCITSQAACGPGCFVYEGVCACDEKPKDLVAVPEVKPSDEKPPRHPEPAWQRGDVIADMPPSTAMRDLEESNIKMRATIQGKKKAHVPLTEEEKTFDEGQNNR